MPFCIALWDQDRLVGFAPLYIQTRLGARVLCFMGMPGDDSTRALCEPAYAQTFLAAFGATLQEHTHVWDVLGLTEVDRDPAPLLSAFPATLKFGVQPLTDSCQPVVDLSSDWEGYLKRFSHQRRWAFKKMRRLAETYGTVLFEVLTRPEMLCRELALFFEARQNNWRNRGRWNRIVGQQRTPVYFERLTHICALLAERGQVWLARLTVDGHPIGWDLAFCVNSTVSVFMSTYDLAYSKCSPGNLVLYELIHYAIDHHVTRFEMGPGAQQYKLVLGGVAYPNKHYLVYAKRPRSFAVLGHAWARDRAVGLLHRIRHS